MRNVFLEMVLRQVKEKFDMEKYDIHLHTQEKSNGILRTGIVFLDLTKGMSYSPIIYLDDAWTEYLNGRMSCSDAAEMVVNAYEEAMKHSFACADDYLTKEFILSNVYMQIVNTKRNRSYLSDVPHKEIFNLSMFYRCHISSNASGQASFVVTNNMLKTAEINEDELCEAALINTKQKFPIICGSMYDFTKELDPTIGENFKDNPMFVMTNHNRQWGANGILYPEYFEILANTINDDLIVIPSSVHELILLPANKVSVEEANTLLNEINPTLDDEDYLGDRVFYYNKEDKTLKIT